MTRSRLSLVFALSAATIAPAISAGLPVNDGLYASDARLCSMSLDQMYDAYGDGVGIHTRTIDGTQFSHNYESGCETVSVTIDGNVATARMMCEGEGEEWEDVAEFRILDKNRFTHMDLDFVRCGSNAAADDQKPVTVDLISRWHEANSVCRGSTDAAKSDIGCAQRDVLDDMLSARGWCYTQEYWSGSENMWHVCVDTLKTNF